MESPFIAQICDADQAIRNPLIIQERKSFTVQDAEWIAQQSDRRGEWKEAK